jgi:hypothetical protein
LLELPDEAGCEPALVLPDGLIGHGADGDKASQGRSAYVPPAVTAL